MKIISLLEYSPGKCVPRGGGEKRETETTRQRQRETERDKERQRETERDRERQRETERET